MNRKDSRLFLVFITIFCVSCSSDYDIQKEINRAVKNGQTEMLIPSGKYVIDDTIVLDSLDGFNLKSDENGKVVITSGIELKLSDFNCLDEEKGIYEYTDKKLRMDSWPDSFRGYAGWPEVYVSGIPMQLARYPNEGYLKIDSVITRGSIPRQGDSTVMGGSFISNALVETISQIPNPQSPIPSLFLGGYWCYKWYDEFLRVESVNSETGEVKMAAPHRYGIGGPSGGLFYAINSPDFLDTKGEYYYNRETGTIRMIIPDHQTPESLVNISRDDFLLMNLRNCSNIILDQIEFSVHNGLALKVEDCDSVRIQRCNFNRLARSAVEISGGSNCGVIASKISFIGDTGISIDGGDRKKLNPSSHYATDNIIHDYARHVLTYAPAVKLAGVGQLVNGNRIFRAPHNAILFTGNDHMIEDNVISLVCMNTSDAGAIYCGRDWTMGGTIIRNNLISELGEASHHHNWAIYLDDLVSGIEVTGNIIRDCPSGILVGGGRYNIVSENTIENCDRASIMYDARGLGWYGQYLNDQDNEIWERLRAMPITESPWKDRFPWLADIPDDDPAIPKHVVIKGNELENTVEPQIHPSVKEYGNVEI